MIKRHTLKYSIIGGYHIGEHDNGDYVLYSDIDLILLECPRDGCKWFQEHYFCVDCARNELKPDNYEPKEDVK